MRIARWWRRREPAPTPPAAGPIDVVVHADVSHLNRLRDAIRAQGAVEVRLYDPPLAGDPPAAVIVTDRAAADELLAQAWGCGIPTIWWCEDLDPTGISPHFGAGLWVRSAQECAQALAVVARTPALATALGRGGRRHAGTRSGLG